MKKRNAPLNINSETFRKNGHLLIDRIAYLLESLPERAVTKGGQPKEIQSFLGNDPLPLNETPLENILSQATELLFEHSLFNGSPRFWGYITSSAAPSGMLADLLASSVNANVGAYILSPMATEIEKQTISWIAEMIGYSKNCGGIFVSGGNVANFTALLAARKAKAGWDIRQHGLSNKQMLIYCSKGAHTWINKAADLFGFGTNNIRWIEMNEHQQINVAALEAQILADKEAGHFPFIVIGNAGSISSGSVDPLDKMAAICKQYDLWFHVDGAYGAPAVIVPEFSHLFKGMEEADSIALDPHKWLYSPLEAGCILVKDKKDLQDAFSFRPDYYNFDGKEEDPVINFHEAGLQNSRGFRALKVWVTLKQVGKNGYIKMIHDDIKLATELFNHAGKNKELEAVSLNLSTVNFRFTPLGTFTSEYLNRLNQEILNRIQAGGEVFTSNAVIGDKYCLRVCIVNFRTGIEDIEKLIAVVLQTGRAVHEEMIRNKKLLKHPQYKI